MAKRAHTTLPVQEKTERRSMLLGAVLLPASAALAAPVLRPDAELVRLAADLRQAEVAYEAACEASGTLGDDVEPEAARVDDLIARMAAIPAEGMEGIAAKAKRLCWSLSQNPGAGIMLSEHQLVVSLDADLTQLAGGAA